MPCLSIISCADIALLTDQGERRLAQAREYLVRQQQAGRFNTARAVEVVAMAIDNAVWTDTKGQKEGRSTYAEYKHSGLGPVRGAGNRRRLVYSQRGDRPETATEMVQVPPGIVRAL
jgi:hypothetical protein